MRGTSDWFQRLNNNRIKHVSEVHQTLKSTRAPYTSGPDVDSRIQHWTVLFYHQPVQMSDNQPKHLSSINIHMVWVPFNTTVCIV